MNYDAPECTWMVGGGGCGMLVAGGGGCGWVGLLGWVPSFREGRPRGPAQYRPNDDLALGWVMVVGWFALCSTGSVDQCQNFWASTMKLRLAVGR